MTKKTPDKKPSVPVDVSKAKAGKRDASVTATQFVTTVQKGNILPFPDEFCRQFNIMLGDRMQVQFFKGKILMFLPPINKRPKAYGKILKLATKLFDGDADAAERWIHSGQHGLGRKSPIEVMRTIKGAKEVEDLIGRIEYGVLA